jgi:hypothetical protein
MGDFDYATQFRKWIHYDLANGVLGMSLDSKNFQGTNVTGWALDEGNTFFGFNDMTIVPTTLDNDVYVEFDVRLRGDEVGAGGGHMLGLGAMLEWTEAGGRKNKTHSFGISLHNTPNYWDSLNRRAQPLCNDRTYVTCWYDEQGTYSEGRDIQYNDVVSPTIALVRDQWVHVRVPLSQLATKLQWVSPPQSWADAKLTAITFGLEGTGSQRYWVEMKNYQVYTRSLVVPPPPIPASGLVGYWTFDGVVTDMSGQRGTATAVGGPRYATSSIGQALMFDGVDDRVDIVSSNDSASPLRYLLRGASSTKSFTITTWIKPSACTRGFVVARSGFVNGLSSDCSNASFTLYTPNNTLVALSDTLQKDAWNFVVAAYDRESGKMWLSVNNAPFLEKHVGSELRDNAEPIQIGGRQGLNWYYTGGIDDVRIYNKVLSRTDIQSLYTGVVPPRPQPQKTTPIVGAVKKSYSWNPLITKHCYSTYQSARTGPDCDGTSSRWFIGTTNENSEHSGGTINDFPLTGSILSFGFHDRGTDGRYEVRSVIDKITNNLFRDRYSFVGFTDSWDGNAIPYPTLEQDIHVAFSFKIPEVSLLNDGVNGQAKARVMLGALGNWNGRAHFVEIDLWRSPDFDICTGLCDPTGTRDQIYRFSGGEGVFYTGASTTALLGAPHAVSVGGAYQTFDVPLTKLFQNTEWSDLPQSWSGIKLNGVYIGTEVWGKGKVWTELKDLETYVLVAAPPLPPSPEPEIPPTTPPLKPKPGPTPTATDPAPTVVDTVVPETAPQEAETERTGRSGAVQGATYPEIPTAIPKLDVAEAWRGYEKVLMTLRVWRDEALAVLRDRYLIQSGN